MFAAPTQRLKRAVYHRGTVGCQACGRPIYIYQIAALADDFSLRCPCCSAPFLRQTIDAGRGDPRPASQAAPIESQFVEAYL
jgi:hypothetical protein